MGRLLAGSIARSPRGAGIGAKKAYLRSLIRLAERVRTREVGVVREDWERWNIKVRGGRVATPKRLDEVRAALEVC